MQKLSLSQRLAQKLSPQQIQFIKLLQVPTAELDTRIEEELEENPALEEGKDDFQDDAFQQEGHEKEEGEEELSRDEELDVSDYLRDDDISGYKMQGDGFGDDDEERETPIATVSTLSESLLSQLGFLRLDERKTLIAKQLIGSIDDEGYIRRPIEGIVNDLAFSQNLETDSDEVESVLYKIQSFDPSGIAARDLRECLLLQLERKERSDRMVGIATEILEDCFDEFVKKHYEKIQRKLTISDAELKCAVELITKLNPKPGASAGSGSAARYITPDFILTNNGGKLELTLNARNAPELRVSRSYAEMLDTYEKSPKKDKTIKEAASFVKQKLDAAKWFIDAVKQRRHTLMKTMNAIVEFQYDFFVDEDESKLRPMVLKDIAAMIDMDVSTVSRVVNSKSVQTDFGIYPLKFFFSEGVSTESGEDVSSREVKHILKEIIDAEEKKKPYSDEKLESLLHERGYTIARRTVAKYREQLGIAVARLRKEL